MSMELEALEARVESLQNQLAQVTKMFEDQTKLFNDFKLIQHRINRNTETKLNTHNKHLNTTGLNQVYHNLI